MSIMYKQIRIKDNTNDILNKCVQEFLRHHPELKEIPISRNKIIYEVCKFYLKN